MDNLDEQNPRSGVEARVPARYAPRACGWDSRHDTFNCRWNAAPILL